MNIVNWGDEIFYLCLFFLEKQSLNSYDATYAECFYGLIRKKQNGSSISKKDREKALVMLIILPYFRGKVYQAYKYQQELIVTRPLVNKTWYLKFKMYLSSLYPALETFICSLYFYKQINFLFGYSEIHSLSFYLLRQKLQRLSYLDVKRLKERKMSKQQTKDFFSLIRFFGKLNFYIGSIIAKCFRILLLSFLYSYRLLEWLMSKKEQLIKNNNGQVLKPPNIYPSSLNGIVIPDDPKICSLCNKKRRNPSACSPGFVFCYLCINKYVAKYGRCPITFRPLRKNNIRRLFEN